MPDSFITALLGQLGAPVTPEATRFLDAWTRAEGTKAAYNPLATTQVMGPQSNFNNLGGGSGVQNYGDFNTGVSATVKTLLNGRYDPIVSGLRSGSATAAQLAQAVANSPWGTGRGVLNVLGSPGASLPNPATISALPSTGMPSAAQPDLTGAVLGSLGKSPAEGLSALVQAVATARRAPASTGLPSTGLPTETSSMPTSTGAMVPLPANVNKWALAAPGADRSGARTNAPVFGAVARIGQVFGRPLTITTGTNHNQFVLGTNRESQHWKGNAADIAFGKGTGPDNIDPELTRLGRAALVAAGMSPAEAAKQTGGVFNVNGWNILFNTMTGGNHYNHLHVGV